MVHTSPSGHFVCFDIKTLGVKTNGLNTDFDGSGVAVNQCILGLDDVNTETYTNIFIKSIKDLTLKRML